MSFVVQVKSYEELEKNFSKDLGYLKRYFDKCNLRLNERKTMSTIFHLNNRKASRSLQLIVNSTAIINDEYPRYLDVKLDKTLTYRRRIDAMMNTLKIRNNIIAKLAGMSWGCNANVLQTLALVLV